MRKPPDTREKEYQCSITKMPPEDGIPVTNAAMMLHNTDVAQQ